MQSAEEWLVIFAVSGIIHAFSQKTPYSLTPFISEVPAILAVLVGTGGDLILKYLRIVGLKTILGYSHPAAEFGR